MKKIAFFTPSLQIGGIERVFITYAEALAKKGYHVLYLTCKSEGSLSSLLPESIEHVSLGNRKLRDSLFHIVSFLKGYRPDVFVTGGDVPNVVAILAGFFSGTNTKVLISHHNYFNIERSSLISKIFFKFFYNRASRVISVSKGITEMLSTQGVDRKKIETIYNPVDCKTLITLGESTNNIPLPERFILFLGRMGEVKNLPFLLESFYLFNKRHSSIHLVLVGDGPIRDALTQKAEELCITDYVHFLGILPNPFPILRQAEAIILPSFSEALPTIILESFVFGKTVISTPTNGAIDLLESGRLGYLSSSFDNANEFAELIAKGLSAPVSAVLLQDKVDQFDIVRKVFELEQLF